MDTLIDYDEAELRRRLAGLADREVIEFLACCVERTMQIVEERATKTSQFPIAELEIAAERIWKVAAGDSNDLSQDEARIDNLYPDVEDPDFDGSSAFLQHAAGAILYTISYWSERQLQDAIWATRQVYEAADYAEQQLLRLGQRLELGEFKAKWDNIEVKHSLVVKEAVGGIEADLDRIANLPVDAARLRLFARAEGQHWARKYAACL